MACLYTFLMIYAGRLTKVLLSCILFAPATLLFVAARREGRLEAFRRFEVVIAALVVAGAIGGVYGLVSGWITL